MADSSMAVFCQQTLGYPLQLYIWLGKAKTLPRFPIADRSKGRCGAGCGLLRSIQANARPYGGILEPPDVA